MDSVHLDLCAKTLPCWVRSPRRNQKGAPRKMLRHSWVSWGSMTGKPSSQFGTSSTLPGTKNIEPYWHHIVSHMNKWSFDQQVPIDTSIYLEQETIKAIVDLHFNPGEGVAYLETASTGLIILCASHTQARKPSAFANTNTPYLPGLQNSRA